MLYRIAYEVTVTAVVARIALASVARDARHVVGWVRFCAAL